MTTRARALPYTTVVDVLLILVRDGQVLLAQRANTGYAAIWTAQAMNGL